MIIPRISSVKVGVPIDRDGSPVLGKFHLDAKMRSNVIDHGLNLRFSQLWEDAIVKD